MWRAGHLVDLNPIGGRPPNTDHQPRETNLEETYYHRMARPDGFAVQLVVTTDPDHRWQLD